MDFARLLRLAAAGMLLALPIACLHVGGTSRSEVVVAAAVLECPTGSEGCPCTGGGGCDPGLSCLGGICSSGGYDDREVTGEYLYEFDEDLAPAPEPTPMRPMSTMDRPAYGTTGSNISGGRSKNRDKAEKKRGRRDSVSRSFAQDLPAGSAAPEGIAPPEPATVVLDPTTGEPQDLSQDDTDGDRQMVYTAGLNVAVYELDAAIEFAESLPTRYGGWIESRYDYQITLRLPAERLFEAIEQLSELGLVLGKTLRADDVTDEYTDLESRILVLEQLVEQLELLLAKAKTVEDALKIRIELDRVRIELEAARVRMRQLSELIDFSTLTLVLSPRGPVDMLPATNDPFPWVDDLGVETTEYR